MVKTQHIRRKGEGGGKKRDKSIESSLKFTGVAAGLAKREIKLISWRRCVHACGCVYLHQCVYSMKCASKCIHSWAVCVFLYMCVLMWVHEGANTNGEGECQGQGQTRETLFTRERWTGRWESERGEKEKREKKREIQGEMLLSLTTKMEVRQGQTVRDHLTSCTYVAHTSPGPLQNYSGIFPGM